MENSISEQEQKALILQLIKNQANISFLTDMGLSYIDILSTIQELEENGILVFEDDDLKVTKQGEKYMEHLNKLLKRKGLYRFVSPNYKFRTKKMNIEDFYIPLKGLKG